MIRKRDSRLVSNGPRRRGITRLALLTLAAVAASAALTLGGAAAGGAARGGTSGSAAVDGTPPAPPQAYPDVDPLGLGIVEAAKRGDDGIVRKLLERDPQLAHAVDADGYTALQWACAKERWRIAVRLLEAGAPVNSVGADGGTALHKACHHDRPDVIARLLEAGADPSVRNQWGLTPLQPAVRRGCREVVKLLLARGADPNAPSDTGWTLLHTAAMSGRRDMMELLLAAGADPARKDKDGRTPEQCFRPRPAPVPLEPDALDQYAGLYDDGRGFHFKVWREGDRLLMDDFAKDVLDPIGPDQFHTRAEPWRVTFRRDERGEVASLAVEFPLRTVIGVKRRAPQYVGAAACAECHRAAAPAQAGQSGPGGQSAGGPGQPGPYVTWLSSRHASAYWRLATDWAKELAAMRPHLRDLESPLTDERCLLCHTTSALDPDALLARGYRREEGVGCEACHGPGSLYADPEVMADRERFLAAGGVVPDERTCRRCHRVRERFDFATWWPKIAHNTPRVR